MTFRRSRRWSLYRQSVAAVVTVLLTVFAEYHAPLESVVASEEHPADYMRHQMQAVRGKRLDSSLFAKYRFASQGAFDCTQFTAVWADCQIHVLDQLERDNDLVDVVIFAVQGGPQGLYPDPAARTPRESKTVAIGKNEYTTDCAVRADEKPVVTRCILLLDGHIAVVGATPVHSSGVGGTKATFERAEMLTFLGAAWAMIEAKLP